ncbi:hypothetical protein PGTUg99_008639 [Puccinia graminis f. sp. tritici]|uniref:Uncharacterized protein n=1 Tax=Puccinia graminis f. sp. tritici TaxID=56615 RepID=A0A5B0NEW2_PUCGR|nr:hypothetical protein PGTUg99_008639 [Puccinia graminis f. sp. tritici]
MQELPPQTRIPTTDRYPPLLPYPPTTFPQQLRLPSHPTSQSTPPTTMSSIPTIPQQPGATAAKRPHQGACGAKALDVHAFDR